MGPVWAFSMRMFSGLGLPISSKSYKSSRVMTSHRFQDGGRDVAILLPISFLVTSLDWEGRNLPVCQISVTFLNPLFRYYYIRFLETNSAMLEFYLLFRFLSSRHHRHNTLHQPTKFYRNRTTHSRVMTS